MGRETVISDTAMRRTSAHHRDGSRHNSNLHHSLFTFLQFKHSLRNRRAKVDDVAYKLIEWDSYSRRKIARTHTACEAIAVSTFHGEKECVVSKMEEGGERCLPYWELECTANGGGRFRGASHGDNPSGAVVPRRKVWTWLAATHLREVERSHYKEAYMKSVEKDPACTRETRPEFTMGVVGRIPDSSGVSCGGFGHTLRETTRSSIRTLRVQPGTLSYAVRVSTEKQDSGFRRKATTRLRNPIRRNRPICLLAALLVLLCPGALAAISVSISPPLSSSPSSRTVSSSTSSSRSNSSSLPSSSPWPSSSLSALPTPWPSSRESSATGGPPPPLWEDDPCVVGGATTVDPEEDTHLGNGRGGNRGGVSPWLRAEVTHEIFDADPLVPGLVYGVSMEWSPGVQMRRLVVTSRVDGIPSGTFTSASGGGGVAGGGGGRKGRHQPSGIVSCTGGAVITSEMIRGRNAYTLNWTLPASGSEVILRISYLPLSWESVLTESAVATAASDLSMGVVTQTLRLLSVCDLKLSKLWGTLSWKDIEHASSAFGGGDCTVHFPSPAPPPPSSSQEPMGLLVDLTRLNVACSLGHLQFGPSSRHLYCGKLEEYRPSERQVHLRGGERPFLRVYSRSRGVPTTARGRKLTSQRPSSMLPSNLHQRLQVSFSLRYRPVESCYNVTLSSLNGSLLIQPPPPSSPLLPPFRQQSDRVRCTLAVHLPYGYRVSLKLRLLGSADKADSEDGTNVGTVSLEAAEEREEEEELSRWRGGEENKRRRRRRVDRAGGRKVPPSGRGGGVGCPEGVSVEAWEDGPWWMKCLTTDGGYVSETSLGNRVVLRVYWSGEEEKEQQPEDNDVSSEVALPPSPPSILLEYAAVEVEAIVGGCGFGWVSLGTRGAGDVGRWGIDKKRRRKRRVDAGMGGGSGGMQGRRATCVGAVETDPLPWGAAEAECGRLGGHLASVRSDEEQAILDALLTRSPGYSEHNSYWVGASDVVREGDFRWTDGTEFSYSNWFPGWASHGHYNRQPNDDGLSGQDCVELRRAYQLPSAPPPSQSAHRPRVAKAPPRPRQPWTSGDVLGGREEVPPHRLSATHAWNDRDCTAANYYVCEREASQPPGRGGGGGREEDGEGDPSAPGADDEFSREGASGGVSNGGGGGGGTGSGNTREGNSGRTSNTGRHRDCNREIRLGGAGKEGVASSGDGGRRGSEGGGSVEGVGDGISEGEEEGVRSSTVLMAGDVASTTIVTSPNFPAPYPDDVRCDTVVTAPPDYRLLLEFEELVLEDEPTCSYDYLEILDLGPKGQQETPDDDGDSVTENGSILEGDEEDERSNTGLGRRGDEESDGVGGVGATASGVGTGRRLCGDWSSRLKLLRHVTSGRSLRLRFVSDYSHRFGGFRARVSMLSAATIECADNRLQPFNNSCYLFVGYPEVTWHTAQQICHGMKAELASVLSPSEYRFVTSSIRGSDQYSNSAIYWLGGKLEEQKSPQGKGKEVGDKEGGGMEAVSGGKASGEESKKREEDNRGAGWHWVDGSLMDFQAWLPESPVEALAEAGPPSPSPPLCLGVRWRQSPSPRLHPSGLHWSSERCSTVGGYVCKRRRGWIGLEPAAKESPPTTRDLAIEAEGKGSGNDFPGDANLPTVPLSSHPSPPSLHPTPRGRQEPWSPPLVMRDRVMKGESGVVTSPGFPDGYPPDVRALVRIVGPPRARLFLRFTALDLEDQPDCLYDYVEVREVREGGVGAARSERWCGSHIADLERFDFVSDTNSAEVFFRSDYSVSGTGFSALWHAVDVSGCPSQTLAASSAGAGETTGVLTSPNHPTALIPRLDCTTTLLAPAGRHVWLEFSESEVGEGGGVELWLGAAGRRPFRPFATTRASSEASSQSESTPVISPPPSIALRHLGDGVFLSAGNRMIVRLWTGDKPRGKGFKASFRAVDNVNSEEHVIVLGNNTHGPLFHLNYPDEPPPNMHFVQRLLAPLGHVVRIRLQDVAVSSSEGGGPTAPPPSLINGTTTTTEVPPPTNSGNTPSCESPPHLEVRDRYADASGGSSWLLCHSSGSVLSLTSYLNTLTVVQRSFHGIAKVKDKPRLNAMVRVVIDPNYKMKLLRISEYEMRVNSRGQEVAVPEMEENKARGLESCHPNPCLNGGKCVGGGPGMLGRRTCQCKGHYTGLFCALTVCDLEPCVFGVCVLSGDGEAAGPGFTCRCFPGYTGTTCDERPRPCADNPCEGRGDCLEKGQHSFICRCHAWWEGTRCERRMLRIPYKPLSERMLHEPFWLGLITVTVVLGIIGLIWCAKRHFPEKLEKLLAEEADRSRHGVSASSSARDNLQSLGGPQPYGVAVEGSHHHHHHQAHPGGQQPPCPPRSLFGRLGIRKPSLLSLTGGGGTSAQMQRPQLAQPTQSPPCPNTPAIPDRKPYAPALPIPPPPSSSHHGSSGPHHHHPSTSSSASSSAARTFSLDDLLKLPPRRSPSSRKKRNNSSPTRKHSATPTGAAAAAAAVMAEAEKKKILQSLVTPAHKPALTTAARLSISSHSTTETLALGECPPNSQENSANVSETKFMGEGGAAGTSVEDVVVLEEPLPGPPLMPPIPPTSSRLEKKVTFARLLSRVSAEMGSSSASGSGSEATPVPKPVLETPPPNPDNLTPQHPSSPNSDESSSVSSSTSSSSFHAMASSGTSPAVKRKSSRNKIQVPVVDALGRDSISTRGPSIFLEPPSSSMCNIDFPPLSPIREMPSPSPSPTRAGGQQAKEEEQGAGQEEEERGNNAVEGRKEGEEEDGDTDDMEEEEDEEEEEEPARVCVTQSPEEEGGGDGGGGEGGEEEEEEGDEGEDDEGEEDDDEDDDETEDDEEDEEDEEEQEGKAEEDHIHHKQSAFSLDVAALEATDDDIGDEGLEEDSPTGMNTMSETTTGDTCSLPKLALPLTLSAKPIVIPTITIQQPSPTRVTTPSTRPHLVLPIGSPPPRRRLSEHHPYPPPIFFQPPLSPQVSQPNNKRLLLHGPDKPTSLDLPMCPPVITVTATMSESDETEDGCTGGSGGRCGNSPFRSSCSGNIGPGGRRIGDENSKCGGQPGMTYLSPFSMCSRGERTASESNLSSSGYSSMASPGPSRAGSNNPLCPADVTDAEDPHQHMGGSHPHHGPHLLLPHHRAGQLLHPHLGGPGPNTTLQHPSVQLHHQHYLNLPQGGGNVPNSPTCSDHDAGTPHLLVPSGYSWTRRPSPLLQTPNMEDATVERQPGSPPMAKSIALRQPQSPGGECANAEFERSSGEEEVEGGEVEEGRPCRRRRAERRNSSTTPDSNDEGIGTEGETGKAASGTQKTLQLPSIVVGVRGSSPPPADPEPGTASRLSPVSSRSESPLSDRVSLPSSSPFGHHSSPRPFSALFFGKGPPLPLTDSDALYDCPSSEVLGGDDSSTGGHTIQTKGLPIGFGLQSPHSLTGTGKASNLLEVPHRQGGLQRKISPKRRVRAPVPICSSSSSSSSLEGIHSKRPSTSSTFVQQSSRCSSSSDRNASKNIEVPFTAALQSPTKQHHYQPRKYKHLRGWISPGATDQKKCFDASLTPHGHSKITNSSNASSSSTATTPLPHDDVNVTGDAGTEIIGKDSKWIYGPEKIALHEALMMPLAGQDPLPQTRKICRMKTIGHQIRFLRRLELTLKRRERLVSPSDSDEGPHKGDDDDEHDRKEDSSQSSSETTKVPLLPTALPRGTKESRYRSSFRRQRRSYERVGRGTKSVAPVLEPLLHQLPVSTSSEEEEEKARSHSSPYRQRHVNLPSTITNTPAIGVTTVPNINR